MVRVLLAILAFLIVLAIPTQVAAGADYDAAPTLAESALMTIPAIVIVTLHSIRRGRHA
jgi:hypothetical protein